MYNIFGFLHDQDFPLFGVTHQSHHIYIYMYKVKCLKTTTTTPTTVFLGRGGGRKAAAPAISVDTFNGGRKTDPQH